MTSDKLELKIAKAQLKLLEKTYDRWSKAINESKRKYLKLIEKINKLHDKIDELEEKVK